MKLGIISPRALIRRALSTFLASTGMALVVSEGSNLRECLDEVKRSRPEMLILDLGGEGLESLPDLGVLGPAIKVVVLMDDPNGDSSDRALELGIWGCLSTRQSPLVFEQVLNSVARGERWLPRQSVVKDHMEKREQDVEPPGELTPREWEVLGLMAKGFRNKEIAARLGISDETVKSHVKAIYGKLRIKGRRDAVLRYYEFIRPPDKAGAPSKGGADESSG